MTLGEYMQLTDLDVLSSYVEPMEDEMTVKITADNIDELLDSGRIEVQMANGRWWAVRRNGATKRWKRDPKRFYVGVKMGLHGYASITDTDTAGFRVIG